MQGSFNDYLANLIPAASKPPELVSAMRYSLLGGGKRIRPLLALATIEATGGDPEYGLAAAAALELIHAYSLIHDDLPAMDNDELRRGLPTCHIAFDEATAILAGDGLQALAFETLANAEQYSPALRLKLIQTLAHASGLNGMVAGQAIDLVSTGEHLDLSALEEMHQLKTGALLTASVSMGAYCSCVEDRQRLSGLRDYARAVGLAFQIQDDIMDVESDTQTLGKTQGKDAANNKSTYTSLLGIEGARRKARELHAAACQSLATIGLANTRLTEIATFIVQRTN